MPIIQQGIGMNDAAAALAAGATAQVQGKYGLAAAQEQSKAARDIAESQERGQTERSRIQAGAAGQANMSQERVAQIQADSIKFGVERGAQSNETLAAKREQLVRDLYAENKKVAEGRFEWAKTEYGERRKDTRLLLAQTQAFKTLALLAYLKVNGKTLDIRAANEKSIRNAAQDRSLAEHYSKLPTDDALLATGGEEYHTAATGGANWSEATANPVIAKNAVTHAVGVVALVRKFQNEIEEDKQKIAVLLTPDAQREAKEDVEAQIEEKRENWVGGFRGWFRPIAQTADALLSLNKVSPTTSKNSQEIQRLTADIDRKAGILKNIMRGVYSDPRSAQAYNTILSHSIQTAAVGEVANMSQAGMSPGEIMRRIVNITPEGDPNRDALLGILADTLPGGDLTALRSLGLGQGE